MSLSKDHIITFHISNAESDSIFANVFEKWWQIWHFLGGRGLNFGLRGHWFIE